MSEQKPREFLISWVHNYKFGEFTGTSKVVIESPTADELENNGVHVIEKAAYDAVVAERDRLREHAEKLAVALEMIASLGAEEMFVLRHTGEVTASDGLKQICLNNVEAYRKDYPKSDT